MNRHKVIIFSMIVLLLGTAALAQDTKFEIAPLFGYSSSSGVDMKPQDLGTGLTINRVSPKSSFSWGFNFDYFFTENISAGFLWSQQLSKVRAATQLVLPAPAVVPTPVPGDKDIANLNVYTYHGIVTYNFGGHDARIRPFVFGGLGATQYSPGALKPEVVPLQNGSTGNVELNGFSRFSTTWGGGIKAFVSPHVGFRFTARWTPTYIKSEATGIWCSPYWPWGCYLVGSDQYSHQGDFSGGIVLRF